MAETDPNLSKMDPALAAVILGRDDASESWFATTEEEATWHPLSVAGFEKLSICQKFELRGHIVKRLTWVVLVKPAQLMLFPDGLVLEYAMAYEELQRANSACATRTLRAFAEAHLKRDLCAALLFETPIAADGTVFLSHRGWIQENGPAA